MAEAIIKLEGAAIRQQKNTILKDVNLEIEQGEFVYLIGRVGSGKSSLLKTLYAELPLEYGKGQVAGFSLNRIKKSQTALLRRKCGIVFQDFKLLTDRNVNGNLEFVLRATGWRKKQAIRERIKEVLEKVGLPDKGEKFPHQLSGGEQQRIVLARALLNAPPLIIADEPTGNIDPETSFQLMELLKDICAGGKTIVISTHQYDLIKNFPGRVFRCEDGSVKEDFSFAPQQEDVNITQSGELEIGTENRDEPTDTDTHPVENDGNEPKEVKEETEISGNIPEEPEEETREKRENTKTGCDPNDLIKFELI